MNEHIKIIVERIKALRDISDISAQDMAAKLGLSAKEYAGMESGKRDLPFTFLNNAAQVLGVDLTELLKGEAPNLSAYTVERAGAGLPIERREGFYYRHLASRFKTRFAEPFFVEVPFEGEKSAAEIAMNIHEGQEFNYILEGKLKFVIDGREELLCAGDSVFYKSKTPHGMAASGGKPCKFIAITIKG